MNTKPASFYLADFKTKVLLFYLLVSFLYAGKLFAQQRPVTVPENVMASVYEQVKTPYKYGLVLVPGNDSTKLDSPTIFRKNGEWYMSYIVFNGRGYETSLAKSDDLLHWATEGKLLSFSDTADWDSNQKAGYIALLDTKWAGSYAPQLYHNKYWLSYLGGNAKGYEAGMLSVGIASTNKNIADAHEWTRLKKPVLKATDKDVRWWEHKTIYKSAVIQDSNKVTGYPFVMYYNAKGDSIITNPDVERIGMAVSNDMINWKRYLKNPVLDHGAGITGDAVLQKIDDVWVMFYFGAFWKEKQGAFNRFACSYDLVNWTDWKGEDLIAPSENYDRLYAHKSFVVKYNGVVYHYYCAVNNREQRGIAVAVSRDIGKSSLQFSKE